MNYLLSICDKSSMLQVFLIIKILLKTICSVVPIIIIIVSMINLSKVISDGQKETFVEAVKQTIKRVIAGLIIFLLPTTINYIFNSIAKGSTSEITKCYESATKEKIEALKKEEERKRKEEREKTQDELEELLRKEYEEAQKRKNAKKQTYEEWKKEREQNNNNQNNNNNNNNQNNNQNGQQPNGESTFDKNKRYTWSSDKQVDLKSAKSGSNVDLAIKKYQNEINGATYAYVDADHFITVTNTQIAGQTVLLTHIVVNSPEQINGAPANGGYGNGLEVATSAASRLNGLITINGSHFLYSNGAQDLKGANKIVIVNGNIMTNGTSGGAELLLDRNGNIYSSGGRSASDLVNSGVKYSFSCHSTQVIANGSTSPSYNETRLYKRTVIGQAGTLDYYIVTDQTYNNKLSNTAEYLKGKGVNNAFSLDQGGSVSLVKGTSLINTPSDGSQRAVGDFLYFR